MTGLTPTSVQPGGGWVVEIEQAWGRWRRRWLRRLWPGYVREMQARRQGNCPNCPHDIVDPRDLKYTRNVCGYSFRPEDDPFRWRDRTGFARHGHAELLFATGAWLLATAPLVVLAILLHWAFWLPVVLVTLLWIEGVAFFRDPERNISSDPEVLVSPADGVVTHVEEVDEPGFEGKALRISIFLSIFNVHLNRMPGAAEVTQVRYFPGAYLDARNPQSAVRNEQLWIDARAAEHGYPMRVKQISGAIARRIVCWLKAGDRLARGQRLGMIKFGSRTDLLVPAAAVREVCVRVGSRVQGGATILLRLAPPTPGVRGENV